jgi:uncharacterized membrane protein
MTEFRVGIFTLIKRLVGHSSLARAIIYTIGHVIIAMTCNRLITGAELELAAVDAVIEPIINGGWFYLLDKLYTGSMNDKGNNI